MTAICYKGGWLAADCGLFDHLNLYIGKCSKIKRHRNGWIVAAAGDAAPGMALERMAEKWPEDFDPRAISFETYKKLGDTCEALVFGPMGQAFNLDISHGVEDLAIYNGCISLGVASAFCMGAMRAGASAKQAVALAARWHSEVRGPVEQRWVGPGRRPRKR